jgi:hypothetical protein
LNMSILSHHSCVTCNASDIEEKIFLFTDVVYLHHQEIFCRLFYTATGSLNPTQDEKQMFLKTKCNLVFQAAAVVVLSVTFASGNIEDEIVKEVSHLTNISSEDIKTLTNVIQTIVLS